MSPHNQQLGRFGEDAAASWYLNEGYQVVDRNWRVREGELDLVCIRRPASTSAPSALASTERNRRRGQLASNEWFESEDDALNDSAPNGWVPEDWATDEWVPDDWATDDSARGDGSHDHDAESEDGDERDVGARSLVVFVEVKTRTSDRFGGGYLAVDRRKQAKLRQLATIWLGSSGIYFDEVRFDVVDVNAKGHLQVWEAAF